MKTASASNRIRMINMLLITAVICADQVSKSWIRAHMAFHETMPVISGVFHITHVYNTGAAFSILQGQRMFFIIVTAIVSAVLIGVMWIKAGIWSQWLLFSLSMIAAGGIGNLIDRMARGYVTDFFDFRLIDFAIFNVADIGVVCGSGLLLLYILVIEPKQEKRNGAN